MSRLDSFVGLGLIGRSVAEGLLYPRIISQLSVAVLLATITGLLISTILIAGFAIVFLTMLHHDMDVARTIILTGGTLFFLTLAMAVTTYVYLKRLRHHLMPTTPLAERASELTEAFMDGFEKPYAVRQ